MDRLIALTRRSWIKAHRSAKRELISAKVCLVYITYQIKNEKEKSICVKTMYLFDRCMINVQLQLSVLNYLFIYFLILVSVIHYYILLYRSPWEEEVIYRLMELFLMNFNFK